MILGTTGSRTTRPVAQIRGVAQFLDTVGPFEELHHGDCTGADWMVAEVARVYRIETVAHPPVQKKFRAWHDSDVILEPKEYLERNRDIVDDSDFLLAVPDGPPRPKSGTWYTVDYAVGQDMSVWVVWPDGSGEYWRD